MLPSFEELESASVASLRNTSTRLQREDLEKSQLWQCQLLQNLERIARSAQVLDLPSSFSARLQDLELAEPLQRFWDAYKQAQRSTAQALPSAELETISPDLKHSLESLDFERCTALVKRLEELQLQYKESAQRSAESSAFLISDALSAYQARIKSAAIDYWRSKVTFLSKSRLTVHPSPQLQDCCDLLRLLQIRDSEFRSFAEQFDKSFFRPILLDSKDVTVKLHDIELITQNPVSLSALQKCLQFMKNNLPDVIQNLSPFLLSTLRESIKAYARRKISNDLDSSGKFEELVLDLSNLEIEIANLGAYPSNFLENTIEELTREWIAQYRSRILSQCRTIMTQWRGEMVVASATDGVKKAESTDQPDKSVKDANTQSSENDDMTGSDDGWGANDWDVEVEDGVKNDSNASATQYSISTIPKDLLELIASSHYHCSNPDVLASLGDSGHTVFDMENEILKCYKALTSVITKTIGYPRTTIYNDCIHLANHVREPALIRGFGERFYALEIQAKRDQIHAIFERTSGLISCTTPSQNAVCFAAIQDIVDLMFMLRERYEGQLTETTMFTALGTLVEAAIADMVEFVMEMTDISAAESEELAKLGDLLTTVENVFKTNSDAAPLAAMWCPSWFRFRLLLDILEAKLDYIAELWQNGSLESDFTSAEVRQLISALFSDSAKRQRTLEVIS